MLSVISLNPVATRRVAPVADVPIWQMRKSRAAWSTSVTLLCCMAVIDTKVCLTPEATLWYEMRFQVAKGCVSPGGLC